MFSFAFVNFYYPSTCELPFRWVKNKEYIFKNGYDFFFNKTQFTIPLKNIPIFFKDHNFTRTVFVTRPSSYPPSWRTVRYRSRQLKNTNTKSLNLSSGIYRSYHWDHGHVHFLSLSRFHLYIFPET